jgi:hypothetical protein
MTTRQILATCLLFVSVTDLVVAAVVAPPFPEPKRAVFRRAMFVSAAVTGGLAVAFFTGLIRLP